MTTYAHNRKASFNYEIQETLEAGIELLGFEAKAVRLNRASLEGAHVSIRGGEAYLMNVQIPPYQPGNTPKDYNPTRTRKLLLSKKEIRELGGKEAQKGLTIIPISMYNKGRVIKVEIAVVRGKKLHDKRQTLKKRETDREIERSLKTK